MNPTKLTNAYKCAVCGAYFDEMGPMDGGALHAPWTFQGIAEMPSQAKLLCPEHHRLLRRELLRWWAQNYQHTGG